MARREDVTTFYSILATLEERIGGMRRLSTCHGRMQWPVQGVYFFFENSEAGSFPGVGGRVVRVGTHALKEGGKSTFWQRLSQHRGTTQGGNHRGSIFRLLVGDALKEKSQSMEPKSWGIGPDPSRAGKALAIARADVIACERELECLVSEHIRSMPFLWLPVEDEAGPKSLRGYVERNSIALLSNYGREGIDQASETWLGHFSSRDRVRRSGLWNNNHVDEQYDSDFLNRFDKLVSCVV
jgi:hypothetical protein